MNIIFEHQDFYIITKPHGLSVHDDEANEGLLNLLRAKLNEDGLMLVHRLDKLTSGLMIISRNNEATRKFNELFSQNNISKTYLALSNSRPQKKQGTIKGDLEKGRGGAYYLRRTTHNPSITSFTTKVINERRVFILKPKTGKTHQLRVVMKSLGAPILGDTLYGGEVSDRMYLHAYKLEFTYLEKPYSFSSLPSCGLEFMKLNLLENLE